MGLSKSFILSVRRAMIEDQSLDRLEQGEANENSIKKKTGTLSSPKSKLTHNASTKFEDDEENNNTSLNLASKASINIGRKVTEEVDGAFTFKAEKVKRPRLQEWSDDD